MSYLDDADHNWSIDPSSKGSTFTQALDGLAAEFLEGPDAGELEKEGAFDLIVAGYLGLRKRHPEATAGECLDTSMIWYFG